MRAFLLSGVLIVAGCKTLTPFEQPPTGDPGTTAPPLVCDAYEFEGDTYNCDQLDRCDLDPANIKFRLACCDCDPVLCDPDPSCVAADPPPPDQLDGAESCMTCHNGSFNDDYTGQGISNPHPFGGGAVSYLKCTSCHGGNGEGGGKLDSHVPVPPQIGDDENLAQNAEAYFNFLTLAGIDKMPDYGTNPVTGSPYSALDWLQFENPGDLRVVKEGRSCGAAGCHGGEHASWVEKSPIVTEMGFYSNTMFTVGSDNFVPENDGLYTNTAADLAFRAVEDPSWVYNPDEVGRVGRLIEMPEYAAWGDQTGFYNNPAYDANTIANFRQNANTDPTHVNSVITDSPLAHVVAEAVTFQCGDCHLGSKGANNRYADFRSSGCTGCHMNYSYDGRSRSTDPNVNKLEPANPDAIAAPERPHVETHQIRNVAKILPNGAFIRGISDQACVGCHQGSNRTVLQYWGIRLDQNQDVVNNFQYPANPNTFTNTAADIRLYDPAVQNNTFNGRNANQYLLYEDYDADGRDDTPEDVHYEAGLGCIDCHGSRDLHNGTDDPTTGTDPTSGAIWSRMGETVGVQCESCHGTVDEYAQTAPCEDYLGAAQVCPTDRFGNPIRNVKLDAAGNYYLTSRLDGVLHYIPQTKDTVVDTGKVHPGPGPKTGTLIYSPNASYAMGTVNGSNLDGVGPIQTAAFVPNDFNHSDSLACDSCHASWNNACVGCHLQLAYNDNQANYFFSNTTGERITVQVTNADFSYISPIWMFLEASQRGEIGSGQPGMKAFYRYLDQNGNLADGITFSDRNGSGNNPNYGGRGAFPALSHNRIYAHSTRGRTTASQEGARQCVACHLNTEQLANYPEYPQYFADIEARNYANLDYNLLQVEIGQNTSNQRNSPYFPHMVAGLGTGLLQFDADGCPNNPLDNNANRFYCPNGAPAANFNANNTVYDLDKVVELNGTANSSHTQPIEDGYSPLRGLPDPTLAGPINALLLQKLANPNGGLILDSWLYSDGTPGGDAANYIQN
jgi:hypothetical protein